jgi:hypothetical protein
MNNLVQKLAEQSGSTHKQSLGVYQFYEFELEKLAQLIVQQCIDKIETYRIPVGNSASGELACEWTYDALREIRDDIKECFGIVDA